MAPACNICRRVSRKGVPMVGSRLLVDVIAHEHVLIAQVQFAARDDRMRPALALDAGQLERALQAILFGAGLDQSHDAVLVAEIEMAIGVHYRGRALARTAARTPGRLAGLHLHTEREPLVVAVAAVYVVPHPDHAAMVILHLA